jgi:hypothetical protein
MNASVPNYLQPLTCSLGPIVSRILGVLLEDHTSGELLNREERRADLGLG